MSETLSVDIGERQKHFLNLVGVIDCSSYSIYSFLKNSNKPVSYKNIHKTLKKLQKLNLIEIIPDKSYRNAKYYKLTQDGVFQILLNSEITIPFLLKNRNDPILKIILYRFFELSTIKYFDTIPREFFISEYLNQCTDKILNQAQKSSKFREETRKSFDLVDEADFISTREIKNFIYTIITLSKSSRMRIKYEFRSGTDGFDYVISDEGEYPNYPYKDYDKVVREDRANDPNYSKLFPNQVLLNDKKFMRIFTEMKEEFEKGCMEFM
jgi:hypothetical protein